MFSINNKNNVFLGEEMNDLNTKPKRFNFHEMNPKLLKQKKFNYLGIIDSERNGKIKEVTEEEIYEDNSGTSLAIIIKDKLLIASDTRHSAEYNINSRKMTKIFKVGEFFLVTTGFYADGFEVYNALMYEIKKYETESPITLKSAAHLLFNILYSRRFFPYYVFPILAGFEKTENGMKPAIYSFDSIGSYESVSCQCNGSGSSMIQPLLDSWVSGKNFKNHSEYNDEFIISLVKKAFDSVGETDVRTKDFIEIYIIDTKNTKRIEVPMRQD